MHIEPTCGHLQRHFLIHMPVPEIPFAEMNLMHHPLQKAGQLLIVRIRHMSQHADDRLRRSMRDDDIDDLVRFFQRAMAW